MKKILLAAAALVAVIALASCDSKACYCYDGPHEQVKYTNTDTPCSALGYGGVGCIEEYERGTMDAGGAAQDV